MHVSKIIIREEHKMKKLIALLLTLAFILSLSCAALAENKLEKILSIGEITFATSPDFAPSEFINPNATGDDQYVGADVELAKYIAQGLGVQQSALKTCSCPPSSISARTKTAKACWC